MPASRGRNSTQEGRELRVAHLATFLLLASSSPFFDEAAATRAKYWITFFVFSVLPAPDSPLWNNHHMSGFEKGGTI